MSLPTSTWGQESDANRIKKTYVKGYMDVSGGELSVHNNAFNVFKNTGDIAFRVDPQKFTVKDSDGSTVDVSLSYLIFLNTLVPTDGQAVSIPDKVKYITTYGTETRIGSTDASYNFRVYGNTYVEKNLFVGLDASFGQRVFVSGDASLNSGLYVKAKTSLGGDLSLNGNFAMYGGDASLNGRVFISGNASLNNNLYVKAKTSLGNDLSLNGNFAMYGGDASLNGRLFVSGDASLNSGLYVKAKTSLGGDLSLNGNFAMYGGDASLNGRLLVSGDASLNSGLYVKAKTSLGGDLSLNGNFAMYGGDASLNGKVFILGDASLNSGLYVKAKTSLGNDLSLNGNFAMYGGDVSLNGRLLVSGDASLNGGLYVVSKTRLGNDLSLNGNFAMYGGDASLNGRLLVSGDASLNSGLYVVSKTRLGNDLSLNGNFAMYGGDASLNGRLLVSGDASLNSGLFVLAKTRFGNDVSLNGNLFVYGGDASLNGRLLVSGDASLNGGLFVSGDASLNSRLFVGGDVSLNGNLYVNRDISLNGNMFITSGKKVGIGKIPGAVYALDVSGNVNISNGSLYINNNLFSSGGASLSGNVQVGTNNGLVTVDKPPFLYDPSMTIFYDFDTSFNTGTLLRNLATGALDATLINGATIDTTNKRFGTGCLDTNLPSATNEYVAITNATQFGTVFSVSLWIKKISAPTPNPERIFDFATATNSINANTIALSIMPTTGFIKPVLTNVASSLLPGGSSTTSVTNNIWNHIVWNVTTTTSIIYINGVPSLTEAVSSSVPNIIRTECYIANSNNTSAPETDYSGLIDNFRFYSGKTLSYAEVYQLYTSQTYNLDVSGGILANGSSVIFEEVGTVATSGENVGKKGTLTLLHGDASGASSIVFPSVNNGTSDYAYIQYQENVPYAGLPDIEAGLLTIGIENDKSNSFIDRMCLWAANGSGFVGINNKFPGYNLDVSGNFEVTTGTSETNPSVTIIKDIGSSADFGTWQHQAQLQIQDIAGNSMVLAMSTDGVGIIQGKKLNDGEYRHISINPASTKGNVGIGKINPAYRLDVNGTVNATSYNATSDYRVKANVMALDTSFNVDVLKPVTYMNTRHGRKDVGFIAHEVQEHYPFLVNGEKDGENMQSLNYIGLIGILTKEIQELKRRLADMEVRVEKSVRSVEYNIHSVDDHVRLVEDNMRSVEDHVRLVETTIEARLVICETDVVLNKSAIKDIGDRFQS